MLLFEKEKNRLIFCEAKHFSNSEIWAEKIENIKVLKQIRRYNGQIKDKEDQIIEAYNNYTKIVKDLFKEKIGSAITYYPIGNVSTIKLENLIEQCNL